MDMPIHTGDPLTPGWGASAGGRKLAVGEAKTILKIPVMPIAWGDALPIFQSMRGPVAPEAWRGAMPVTYRVGGSSARVHLKLAHEWRSRPLYNVVARIPGSTRPDEWVIYGNHHDAWVNGADDPTSGAVSLLEAARGFGELLKSGWRPQRTIVLALWDGEEWGLLGSTEWAEAHRDELAAKAVAYINTDGNGKGWLNAGGSHSLQQFISEVARDVADPKTGKPVLELARRKAIDALPEAERAEAEKDPNIRIAPLGSGSDFTPFLQHLTLAALNLSFGGDSPGGVYHSAYDSFEWYTRFSDGEFVYGKALAQMTGTAILRLSEAPVLPFRFSDMSDTLARYVSEVQKLHGGKKDAPAIDFAPLTAAVGALSKAALAFEKAHAVVPGAAAKALQTQEEALKVVNQLIYSSERRLGNDAGLPRRDWFRHQIYAPGFYTGYGVKTLPQVREGIEEGQWDEARQGVAKVTAAISALAQQVDRASAGLSRVSR
jgi:N-acetylated-alpha-linked acidic dipeptidase